MRAHNRLPILLALAAVAVAGFVGWQLVKADVAEWEAAGYTVGPEMQFVIFCMVFAGIATFAVSRRVIDGPKVRGVLDYSLSYPQARLATNPTVRDLVDRLDALGYRIRADSLDETDVPSGRAARSDALVGNTYRLTHSSTKSVHAGLTLRFAPTRVEAKNGTALIEAADYSNGPYNEMAMYAIRELGELFPDLTYQTTGSSLDADPVSSLATLLPVRPSHLVAQLSRARNTPDT